MGERLGDDRPLTTGRRGMDHKRLAYRHMGRDFRLTDVGGNVVHKALRAG